MRRFLLSLGVSLFFGTLFLLPQGSVFAEITEYKSAQTVLTAGNPPFINLENCSETEGLTCDRVPPSTSYGRLYFQDFGDFGIPEGSTITHFRMRVTGKATVGVYAGALDRKDISGNSCLGSAPSYIWQMWDLFGSVMSEWNRREQIRTGTLDSFDYCFTEERIKNNNFTFMVWYSGPQFWTANIDNFEVAFEYEPPPPPPAPEPFLDLPWDYDEEQYSVDQIIFDPGSWFDHEYPLQDFCCSPPVLNFRGKLLDDGFYRSHSGYDYNSKHGVFLNTLVLAAASGWATFTPESQSGGAGNTIKINHENGYQTWYEHLSYDDLIVSSKTETVYVQRGETIGKVGMTGNTTGPHIHLSVIKDANDNGTFIDDYPWGLTDPLGWDGDYIDPWIEWESNGRNGSPSYNLFLGRRPSARQTVGSAGGNIRHGNMVISFLENTFSQSATLSADHGPFESIGDTIKSIMPSIFIEAIDLEGNFITEFIFPITLTFDYSDVDLSRFKEDSLKIYWFNESSHLWEAMESTVDMQNKTVSAETLHFSQFSLMAELVDTSPPTTEVVIAGSKGQDSWYRSDVLVELLGLDTDPSLGILYTLYKRNDNAWSEYIKPLSFVEEGTHSLTFQTFDIAGNIGERETFIFAIDRTSPEVFIDVNQKVIWPPDGQMVDITITGSSGDENLATTEISVIDEYDNFNLTGLHFGQTIQLPAIRHGTDKDGRIYEIRARAVDKAGNEGVASTSVSVPHDMRD